MGICRWFGGKARAIQQLKIIYDIPLGSDSQIAHLLLLDLRYTEGANDIYLLPLAVASDENTEALKTTPQAIISRLKTVNASGVIYDGAYNETVRKHLLRMIANKRSVKGDNGDLVAYPGKSLKNSKSKELPFENSQLLRAEQSNTSVLYGTDFILKLYRRLDEGINPDLEIGRFLAERVSYANTPAFSGAIEYRRDGAEPIVIGILQQFVRNEGDAWTFTLDSVGRFLESVLAKRNEIRELPKPPASLLEVAAQTPPALVQEVIGGIYFERARLLAQRAGELHLSLAREIEDHKFTPEPFSLLYQRLCIIQCAP